MNCPCMIMWLGAKSNECRYVNSYHSISSTKSSSALPVTSFLIWDANYGNNFTPTSQNQPPSVLLHSFHSLHYISSRCFPPSLMPVARSICIRFALCRPLGRRQKSQRLVLIAWLGDWTKYSTIFRHLSCPHHIWSHQ